MKLIFLLAAFTALAAARRSRRPEDSVALEDSQLGYGFVGGTFDQCVDHYDKDDPNCANTFKQRYWYSKQDYKKDGPLFVYTGAEDRADNWVGGGQWIVYGRDHGAMYLVLEHRFYGKSYPKAHTDRSSATMKLLSSRQALKDYAKLIKWFIDEQKLSGAKVVVNGGSYAGTLAAWFRQKYPEIANVAISSSAPVMYQYEFPEYIDTSALAIKESNLGCFNKIQSTFECLESLVNGSTCAKTKSKSIKDASIILSCATNYCDLNVDFNDATKKSEFFIYVGRKHWADNHPATSATKRCDYLLAQKSGDLIWDYQNFLRDVSNNPNSYETRRRRSSNFYRKFSSVLATADNDDSESEANYQTSWVWQTCNEFGSSQTSDKNLHMLGYNTIGDGPSVANCKYRFPDTDWTADMIRKNVDKTNVKYKGRDYSGTCTIFTHGTWDPWRVMGINEQSQTSDANTVFLIQQGEHTEDMNGPSGKTTVTAAQEKVKDQLRRYLLDPNC